MHTYMEQQYDELLWNKKILEWLWHACSGKLWFSAQLSLCLCHRCTHTWCMNGSVCMYMAVDLDIKVPKFWYNKCMCMHACVESLCSCIEKEETWMPCKHSNNWKLRTAPKITHTHTYTHTHAHAQIYACIYIVHGLEAKNNTCVLRPWDPQAALPRPPCMYVCMYACMCVCMCMALNNSMHFLFVCMVYVCVYMNISVYLYSYIYIYIYIYTHTYIHICMHAWILARMLSVQCPPTSVAEL